jgi:DMSO/TMAO reductase YedYZ molybdopterin-dependent catalytic subunit
MKEKFINAQQIKRRTILSFSVFLVAAVAAFFIWKGLRNQQQDEGQPKTLRKALRVNETIFSGLFSEKKLVKTYPVSEAVKNVRVNGDYGLKDESFDPTTWKMEVVKGLGDTISVTMDEIKKLPKTDVVFDFKCIEGWSQKTWWGGVRFSDFIKAYGLDAQSRLSYAGLVTPDKEYYVGIDMPSMLQPQTILCYEMNGKALPMNQGYPLRLIIPVKYGIKHIKRIGTLSFSNNRPADYWAENGYDYYAGH